MSWKTWFRYRPKFAAAGVVDSRPRRLELDELEKRILMSATPLGAFEADLVEEGSSEAGHESFVAELFQQIDQVSDHVDAAVNADASSYIFTDDGSENVPAGDWVDSQTHSDTLAGDFWGVPDSNSSGDVTHWNLIFVDSDLPDLDQLLSQSTLQSAHTKLVYLTAEQDGIQQISDFLDGLEGPVDSLQILTHGTRGNVQLGSAELNLSNLQQYEDLLVGWKQHLTNDADVLFYGCDVAGNAEGELLVRALAELTGADVAASSDATGAEAMGGDWNLEFVAGEIATEHFLIVGDWNHVLDLTATTAETQVNSTTTNVQHTTPYGGGNLASNDSGQYVVVWDDDRSGNSDVYAKVYSAGGTVLVNEFQVHGTNCSAQDWANVAMADNGNFVVTWSDNRSGSYETYMRLYDIDGVALTGETEVSTNPGTGDWHAVDFAADGSFIVTFQNGSNTDIYYQRYSAAGSAIGGNTRVNQTTTDSQYSPDIAVADDGSFVVSWNSTNQDGSGAGVYARRYNSSGTALSNEFLVNQTTAGEQYLPVIDSDASGNFVISWLSGDGNGYGIYGRRYQADGTAISNEFLINTYTQGDQAYAHVDMNDSGDFVVVWADTSGKDGSGLGIYAQQFDSVGTRIGGEVHVSSTTSNSQTDPTVAYAGSNVVFVWSGNSATDTEGVVVREFSATNYSTLTVDTAADYSSGDGNFGNVSSIAALLENKGADGKISLREAIQAVNASANGTGGADRIYFAIGSGAQTITVSGSDLTQLVDAVWIDGTTQTGFSSSPLISIVDGASLGYGVRLGSGSDGSTIQGLNIQGFSTAGIEVLSSTNTIVGNWIGTNSSGNSTAGNGIGIRISTGDDNVIGGITSLSRNVISGNTSSGISLLSGANNSHIMGNYIGLGADGSTSVGNVTGISVSGSSTGTIIGTNGDGSNDTAERNVISANQYGVLLSGSGTSSNHVYGNYIGTDTTGLLDRGNTNYGVRIESDATGNYIGGTAAGTGNLIAGNDGDGIQVNGENTDGNYLYRNLIGLAADGTTVLGNSGNGIAITGGADNTIIGGIGLGNTIVGSGLYGIHINGSSTGTALYGNYIGTNAAANLIGGNSRSGVFLESGVANTTVGGTTSGQENVISNNGEGSTQYNAGVQLATSAGTGNLIVGNQIYSNSGIAIDLGATGPDAIDSLDSDSGPNNLQNYPVLTQVTTDQAGTVTVSGALQATASLTGIVLHFYATPATANYGSRDAKRYLGSTTVNSDGSGNVTFTNVVLSGMVDVGEVVSATATYASSTSEVSGGVYAEATGGNAAPSEIRIQQSSDGGFELNVNGGNDSYLMTSAGGDILGGRTELTLEIQLATTQLAEHSILLSYATSTTDNTFLGEVDANGNLRLLIHGAGYIFTGYDLRTLNDGQQHSIALAWKSSTGAATLYVDGNEVDSLTSVAQGVTLYSGGTLTFGQEQDSVGGGFNSTQVLNATLFDVRIFSDVRTAAEIQSAYHSTLPYSEQGLVANWRFDELTDDGRVLESVAGNHLTLGHATGTGFVSDSPALNLSVDENAVDGTIVGQLQGIDAEREARISQILAADSTLRYNAETGKFYKIVSSSGTWSTARTSAVSTTLGGVTGELVTINSAHENQFIWEIAQSISTSVWLGASDQNTEGRWQWYDGSTAGETFWYGTSTGSLVNDVYANWETGEPNNSGDEDVAYMYYLDGQWNDTNSGTSTGAFIVQWDSDDVLNATNALTYSIQSQTVAGAFSIDSTTGLLTVADGTLLDYESQTSHTLTVRVSDGTADWDQVFTIDVADLAEPGDGPTDITSGIEINTDGGNDTYLQVADGGAVLGGLNQMTLEVQFSSTDIPNNLLVTSLVGYTTASDGDEMFLALHNNGGTMQIVLQIQGAWSPVGAISTADIYDGAMHSIAATWDGVTGTWQAYFDGQFVGGASGYPTTAFDGASGNLVFGSDPDVGSDTYAMDSDHTFSGTFYDVRVWSTVRTSEEIAQNYLRKITTSESPVDLLADWQMDGFNGSQEIVDVVSGNNATVQHASGAGFITGNADVDLTIDENANDGTSVGSVQPSDWTVNDVVNDGLFLEAAGSTTQYGVTGTFGDWTVSQSSIDLFSLSDWTSPLGGRVVNLDGASPGGIEQNLTTVAGRQYQVVFSLTGDFSGGEAIKNLRVSADGISQDFAVAQTINWSWGETTSFQQRSFTFTAQDANTLLSFLSLEGASSTYGPYLADIRVIEIPPEVSTVLANDSTLSYDAATGKFYKFVDSGTTFTSALSNAIATELNGISGELLTIDSQYENDYIWTLLQSWGSNVWLGATDQTTEGSWYWLDSNSESTLFWTGASGGTIQNGLYSNWRSGEPNDQGGAEDGAEYVWNSGYWNDLSLTGYNKYIVQWDATEVLSHYNFTLTDDAGGRFTIDSQTGEILVADGSLLDYETSTSHSVTVQVTDAAGNSYSEVMSIAVNNLAGEPIQTLPIATQNLSEDGSLTFSSGSGNAITVSDTSATTDLPLQIELTVAQGTLTLSQTTGLSIVGGSNGSAHLVIQGTESDLNAALEGLLYQPAANYNGSDQLTITTSLSADLVAHYDYEADATDQSWGTAQDGTLAGDAAISSDGTRGNVLQLDGTGDFVDLSAHAASFDSLSEGTLATWFQATPGSGWAALFSFTDMADVDSGLILAIDASGNLVFQVHENGVALTDFLSADTVDDGQWHHVAVSVSAAGTRIYLDGVEIGTLGSTAFLDDVLSINSVLLGRSQNSGGPTGDYQGLLDETRVYSRSLSYDEVVSLKSDQASTTGTVNLSVAAVNDAPVLVPYGPYMPLNEDGGAFTATVASLLQSSVSDVDSGAVEGVAISSLSANGGVLEYSLDGVNWSTVGTVSTNQALLLRATDYLRFTPSTENGGTSTLSYHAWDQTTGTAGTLADVTSNGGTTAYSTATDTVTVVVNSINDAPVLDNSGAVTLDNQLEDAGAPVGAVGTLVSSLVQLGGNVSDVDNGAVTGVAITATDTTNGTWWYTLDGGSTWSSVGTVTDNSPRLLAADSNTRIYFQSNADYNGTITNAITFRAWDQTSGSAGSLGDASSNGGTTAYSSASEVASLTVISVNDAPSGTDATVTATEGVDYSFSQSDFGFSDPDGDAIQGVVITTLPTLGTLFLDADLDGVIDGGELVTAGQLISEADLDAGRLKFRTQYSDAQGSGYDSLTFQVRDGGGTANGGANLDATPNTLTIDVTNVNDLPALLGDNLLNNSSFDSDLSSWNVTGSTDWSAGELRFGQLAAANGTASQTFATTIGETYYVTFNYGDKNVSSSQDLNFLVSGATSLLEADIQSSYVGSTMVGYTFKFVADSTSTTLTFTDTSASHSGVRGYLDDIEVRQQVSGAVSSASYTENATITIDSTINLNDVDDLLLESATVQLSSGYVNGQDVLGFVDQNGIVGSWDAATGTLTLTGSASLADYQTALRTVTYHNTSDNPDTQARTVTFTINDGDGNSNSQDCDLSVIAVNDDPVNSTPGTVTVAEETETSISGISISDLDSSTGNLTTRLTVTNGVLKVTLQGGAIISVGSNNSSAFTLLGTQADINATLATLTYRGDTDVTGVNADTLTVTTNDLGNSGTGGAKEDTDNVQIDITNLNDEENLTTNTGATVLENSTGNVIDNSMLQTVDSDNTTTELVYTITTDVSNGTLFRNGVALLIGSTFTQQDVDSGLLTYNHDGTETSSDSFGFQVDDGAGTKTSATFSISVTAVNDQTPVIQSDGAGDSATVNVAENTTHVTTVAATDGDLPAETLSYSIIGGADASHFAIDNATGVLSFVGAKDREAVDDNDLDGIYEVIVQASDGTHVDTQTIQVNLTDADEFDVSAVADADGTVNQVAENSSIGTTVGVTASASDADATTNAISYSLTNNDGGRFAIDSTTGVVTVAGAIDREADGGSRSITVRATSADGSFSDQSFTILIADVDEFDTGSVTDTDATANQVVENSSVGTAVGVVASASDADATNNTISYTLTDNDGGRFAIDSTTGVVTVAGAIDREVDGASRSITVRATSTDGSFTDQSFSIGILDADEFDVSAIVDADGTVNQVAENSSIGTTVGVTASASDADATTNTISYSLTNNDGGRFAIDSTTGVVTVAGAIDREADGSSRSITVRATSADGSFSDQSFTILIADVDEFDTGSVTDSDATANQVAENSSVGTAVGVVASASDADATNNTISYTLTDNAGGRFAIDSSTGVVTVAGLLDYETATSHTITVLATSSDGSFSSNSFTIQVLDVNEAGVSPISDADATGDFVLENSSLGSVVGVTALATDSDGTDTVSYSLDDDASGRFAIDSTTGVVTVAGAIDREIVSSLSIVVRATSSDGTTTTRTFNIAIGDVDEFDATAPVDTDGSSNSVNENAAVGAIVGLTASSSDGDATLNQITYSLLDSDGGRFQIDANTGVVTTAMTLDREILGASRNIVVRATSADGSFADSGFSININDIDEFDVTPAADVDSSANEVAENMPVGTLVGITAQATDGDATLSQVSYSLSDSDGGRFQIDSNSGLVTTEVVLDRESLGGSRTIVVRATSTDGSITDTTFTIQLLDVDEFDVSPISDTNILPEAVAENAAIGTSIGFTAFAQDLDATTNAVSYSLASDAGGLFSVDSSTGVVSVAAALDYETATSHSLTLRATSADGSWSDRTFVVNVINVNEFGVSAAWDNDLALNLVSEHAVVGTSVGVTAKAVDLDSTDTVSYGLVNDSGGAFAIDTVSGVVSVAGALDYETLASHTITVRSYSSDGSFADSQFLIQVVDQNDVPTNITISNANIGEHASPGTVVGNLAAVDQDTWDLHSFQLTGGTGVGVFEVGLLGQVTLVSPLDYEATSTYTLEILATDLAGASVTKTLTINVTDQNDLPIAQNDSFSVAEDQSLQGNVIAGSDTDQDGDALSAVLISGPTHASRFILNADGSFDYQGNANYNGQDQFQYRVTDGQGNSNVATVQIQVSSVNDAPVAVSDSYVMGQAETLQVLINGVLSNDSDIENDPVVAILVQKPAHGTLQFRADGTFTYVPDNSFFGIDEFTYVPNDGAANGNVVRVQIVIQGLDNSSAPTNDGGTSSPTTQTPTDNDQQETVEHKNDSTLNQNTLAALDSRIVTESTHEAGKHSPSHKQNSEAKKADTDASGTTVESKAFNLPTARDAANILARLAELDLVTDAASLAELELQLRELDSVSLAFDANRLWSFVDTEAGEKDTNELETHTFFENSLVTGSIIATAGYVLWTLRGGVLVATMMTSFPSWKFIDPLPVLDSFESGMDTGDSESIHSLLDNANQELGE